MFTHILQIIIIFILFSSSIYTESRKEREDKRKQIGSFIKDKNYSGALTLLEEYTENHPEELLFHLYLARAYLFRKDILPNEKVNGVEEIYKKRENFLKARKIYAEKIPVLENKLPGDPTLPELYFEWGLASQFSGDEDEAFSKFRRSSILNPKCRECFYNMAMIQEKKGNLKESDRFFYRYNKLSEEMNEKKD